MSTFGEKLREAREVKGLSQTDLAKLAQFQPSAISHFETGRRSPSFDNLRRLADALSVTIDYLLGRAEEPRSSGPLVEKLFRDIGRISEDDKRMLGEMAAILARKNEERLKGATASESSTDAPGGGGRGG